MERKTVKIDFEPCQFELGQKVFVVGGPADIIESEVTAFQGLIFKDEGRDSDHILCIPKAVRLCTWVLNDYFQDMNPDYVPLKYITADHEEATRWAMKWPVHLTPDEWYHAIGDRDNIDIEDCELGICCADISAIRDILIQCKEKDGITGWEREWLQGLLRSHTLEVGPVLREIFLTLELEWNDD